MATITFVPTIKGGSLVATTRKQASMSIHLYCCCFWHSKYTNSTGYRVHGKSHDDGYVSLSTQCDGHVSMVANCRSETAQHGGRRSKVNQPFVASGQTSSVEPFLDNLAFSRMDTFQNDRRKSSLVPMLVRIRDQIARSVPFQAQRSL